MVEWISGLAGENNSGFAESLATGKEARQELTCIFVRGAMDCAKFERFATGSLRGY